MSDNNANGIAAIVLYHPQSPTLACTGYGRITINPAKRLKENPWLSIKEKFKVNDIIDTTIVNIVDFGIFVKVYDEIDGKVHISDLDRDE